VYDGEPDHTERILAEHGTPEQQRDYALMEAARHKGDACREAALARQAAAGSAQAGTVHEAVWETAHATWTVRVAESIAGYASAIGAAAPAGEPSPGDPASPYARSWLAGGRISEREMTHPPDGYDDGQRREYAAGCAVTARLYAEATLARAALARQSTLAVNGSELAPELEPLLALLRAGDPLPAGNARAEYLLAIRSAKLDLAARTPAGPGPGAVATTPAGRPATSRRSGPAGRRGTAGAASTRSRNRGRSAS
jgi:hypothetical protein